MLELDLHLPEGPKDGSPLVLLLHGRGADKGDLVPLGRFFPNDVLLATPRAPFPGAPWGYGPGWAWYRYLAEDRPEPSSFAEGQRALDQLVAALPGKLPVRPGALVLGGFSQGGTMSLAWALRNAGEAAAVLNFSGFLASHPEVKVNRSTAGGLGVFWGHGTSDPAIPFALAQRGRKSLRAAGADLTAREYPIGHWIDPREMTEAVDWLLKKLGRSPVMPE